MEKFTADNFKSGFLMDEELMAGISESPEQPGIYTAYVVRHTTGETLGVQNFTDMFEAIRTLNDIPRSWNFETVTKCGNGNCGKNNGAGGCSAGGCGKKKAPATETTETSESCSTGKC